MSDLRASNFRGRISGSVPDFPDGAVISGISTFNAVGVNIAGVSTFAGTVTAQGLTSPNVTVTGITTSSSTIVGSAVTTDSEGIRVAGVITATSFVGSGANLTDVISGIGVTGGAAGGSVTANLGTGLTAINFSGATATYHEATGISTITIASAGIETTQQSGASGYIVLDLGAAQHHNIILAAGFSTFIPQGGDLGASHSVVVHQPSSGITTVGFDTHFLWPSASAPNLSRATAASQVDLISFVVSRAGQTGIATQLLGSAGIAYSN